MPIPSLIGEIRPTSEGLLCGREPVSVKVCLAGRCRSAIRKPHWRSTAHAATVGSHGRVGLRLPLRELAAYTVDVCEQLSIVV